MKKLRHTLIIAIVILAATGGKAAVVELSSGTLDALKGQTNVNIQYDYSRLTVNGYPTLEEYVNFKKKKYEEHNKGEKSGDEWYKNWLYDRDHVLQPRMEDIFNKKTSKCGLTGKQNNNEAKYTLIFQINHYIETNAGWPYYIGVTGMYEAKIFLVETAAPDKKLATIRADYQNEIGDLGGSVGNFICKQIR